MTAERDYSIRRPTGTREISGYRTVTNRKEERRKRREETNDRDRDAEHEDEGAVEVELAGQEIEPPVLPEDDSTEEPDDRPAVDYLA